MWNVLVALAVLGSSRAAAGDPPPTDAATLMQSYEEIRVELVGDRAAEAATSARALASGTADPALAAAALAVADAQGLDAMRIAYGEVSRLLVLRFGAAPPDGLRVYHCPMTEAYPYWLQDEPGLQNPYMGTAMPTCGSGVSLKVALKAAARE